MNETGTLEDLVEVLVVCNMLHLGLEWEHCTAYILYDMVFVRIELFGTLFWRFILITNSDQQYFDISAFISFPEFLEGLDKAYSYHSKVSSILKFIFI